MRVAIIGAGSLGALFGGLLAHAGEDVTFVVRGANLHALCANGLIIKRLTDEELHLEVSATADPGEVGPVDLVWFCTKTYDLYAAARQCVPLIGPETLALTIQNGVDAPDQVAAVLGGVGLLGGVVLGGASLVAPGVVEQRTPRMPMHFGEIVGGSSARVDQLHPTLLGAGIDSAISRDVRCESWEKFILSCAALGLSSLTRLPYALIFACPETAELAEGIMAEAEAVGQARGVVFESGTVERLLQLVRSVATTTPAARGSMYLDLVEGRRLELDAINGCSRAHRPRGWRAHPLKFCRLCSPAPVYPRNSASRLTLSAFDPRQSCELGEIVRTPTSKQWQRMASAQR